MVAATLATVTPANSPGGAILSFALPMALFFLVSAALYLLLRRHDLRPAPSTHTGPSAASAIHAPEPPVGSGQPAAPPATGEGPQPPSP